MGWSNEQLAILRQYPKKTIKDIVAETGKTESAVRKKLIREGLRAPVLRSEIKRQPPPFKGKGWAESEKTYLQENYRNKSLSEIGATLDRSENSVRNKLIRMGLYEREIEGRKYWTDEEKAFIEDNYHRGFDYLSKRLNRSKSSVKHQSERMGLHVYSNEYLCTKHLADIFGADASVVRRWVKKLGLPCKVAKRKTHAGKNFEILFFEAESFWKWAEKHKKEINWNCYEFGGLPPEPEWLKYAKFSCEIPENHRKSFTTSEVEKIKSLYHKGFSVQEIADMKGRTKDSIKHVLRKK